MSNYIDGFVFPILKNHLEEYKKIATQVGEIWKEYGALNYVECLGDHLNFEGTKSFSDVLNTQENEVVIFGWVTFPSKEIRDLAHKKVPEDPRMNELVAPLMNPEKLVFDASRMVFGGFETFSQK